MAKKWPGWQWPAGAQPQSSSGPWYSASDEEIQRLKSMLLQAPGPVSFRFTRNMKFSGPSDSTLTWGSTGSDVFGLSLVHSTSLVRDRFVRPPSRNPGGELESDPAYLELGRYCYAKQLDSHRLVVWRHVGQPGNWSALRISAFDTLALEPFQRLHHANPDDPVRYGGRSLCEIDLPTNWTRGRQPFDSPVCLQDIPELLLLVSTRLPDSREDVEALYVVRPKDGFVDVLPLDWWNAGDFDFGYEWITHVVRDPPTDRIAGAGIRIYPFVMDSLGGFLGWLPWWSEFDWNPQYRTA